jgi:hypothetical protein
VAGAALERGDAAARPAAVAGQPAAPPDRRARGDTRRAFRAGGTPRAGPRPWIRAVAGSLYPTAHRPLGQLTKLDGNGDDCDGLELLVYSMLREFGFAEDEVYRAIVVRPSDGQHHMVTLWFEERSDPWVIDPTGAMTSGMPHMSEVPGWHPLKVFGAEASFTVERLPVAQVQR